MIHDTELPKEIITIWNRCWASEHIYAKLLGRDRRLRDDPLMGELLHRRGLFGQGMAFMLAPAVAADAAARRDATDLDVDPEVERKEFIQYAMNYKWFGMLNHYTDESLDKNAKTVVMWVTKNVNTKVYTQRFMTIPTCARTALIVGNQSIDDPIPGGWLPFSSARFLKFMSIFGRNALAASYIDVNYLNDHIVSDYKTILTTDMTSERLLHQYKTTGTRVINMLIPVDGGEYSAPGRDKAIEDMAPGLWWLNSMLKGVYDKTPYL
jgi:hypothetical protein